MVSIVCASLLQQASIYRPFSMNYRNNYITCRFKCHNVTFMSRSRFHRKPVVAIETPKHRVNKKEQTELSQIPNFGSSQRLKHVFSFVLIASCACALPAVAKAAASAAPTAGGLSDVVKGALDFILHLDVHLGEIIAAYGRTTYAILFAIVFAETGLVITPFLPGDSLLFATGAMAALGKLNVLALMGVYIVAATLGDAVNYAIGNYLGTRAIDSKLIKKEYIQKTEDFYAKYGGKTVVLARFVPIVRTFAPFVAGVGSMSYGQFGLYNVVGAFLWTIICTGAGYAFGNVPAVHDNFSLVVLGIVAVSVLPLLYEIWAAKREATQQGGQNGPAGKQA